MFRLLKKTFLYAVRENLEKRNVEYETLLKMRESNNQTEKGRERDRHRQTDRQTEIDGRPFIETIKTYKRKVEYVHTSSICRTMLIFPYFYGQSFIAIILYALNALLPPHPAFSPITPLRIAVYFRRILFHLQARQSFNTVHLCKSHCPTFLFFFK